MNNIVWVTGFDETYYKLVFDRVRSTWDLLSGDKRFYLDQPIADLSSANTRLSNIDLAGCPNYLSGKETKFWRKSRSIIQAIKESRAHYDYCVWIDADVRVLKSPAGADIFPAADQLFSVNNKIISNPPTREQKLQDIYLVDLGIDTGFLAFNLKHPDLDKFLDLYEKYWHTDAMRQMIRKYDTYALMDIVDHHNIAYRNLWRGTNTAGKHYCGFEDSELEQYFYHHWGKKNKGMLNELD